MNEQKEKLHAARLELFMYALLAKSQIKEHGWDAWDEHIKAVCMVKARLLDCSKYAATVQKSAFYWELWVQVNQLYWGDGSEADFIKLLDKICKA